MKKSLPVLLTFYLLISIFKCYESPILLSNCKKGENMTKSEIDIYISNNIRMGTISGIFFIGISPINLLILILIFYTFIKFPQTLKQPQDIFFDLCICEFVICIDYIWLGIYNFYYKIDQIQSDGIFCQINAIIQVFFQTAQFLYNCSFCFFFMYKLKGHLLNNNKNIPIFIVHLIVILLSMVNVLVSYFTNILGKNIFGTCTINALSNWPFFEPILVMVFLLISIGSIIYFRKKIPTIQNQVEQRQDFISQFYVYIICIAVNYFIILFFDFYATYVCFHPEKFIVQNNDWLIPCRNFFIIMAPFILIFVRLKNRFISGKVKILLRRIFKQIKKDQYENLLQSNETTQQILDKQSVNIDNLTQQIKMTIGQTILATLMCYYNQQKNILVIKNKDNDQIQNEEIQSQKIQITKEYIEDKYPILYKSLVDQKISPCEFEVMYPQIFNDLIEKDKQYFSLENTFDLQKNIELLKKSGQADGGQGGDWFFFTYDNSIVLKSMNDENFDTVLNMINKQKEFFDNNDESLLSKIYGLFKFTIKNDNGEDFKYKIYMQRNLSMVERKFILRVYDVKGSLYKRFSLKPEQYAQHEQFTKIKSTLKDIDFNNLEEKLYVDQEFQQKIIKQVERDSQFLLGFQLLDYSLIIFIIDHDAYINHLKKEKKFTEIQKFKQSKNKLNILQCSKKKGVYYHIGIIDYLQQWNNVKFLENKFKRIINFNPDLQISALQPDQYCPRFQNYIKKIVEN